MRVPLESPLGRRWLRWRGWVIYHMTTQGDGMELESWMRVRQEGGMTDAMCASINDALVEQGWHRVKD